MDNNLKELINNSPSIIRNSFVISFIRIIAWILGVILFMLGLSFIITGFFSEVVIEMILPEKYIEGFKDNNQIWNSITILFGFFGLLLCFLMLFITKISKMILNRNQYIKNILEWKRVYEEKEKNTHP